MKLLTGLMEKSKGSSTDIDKVVRDATPLARGAMTQYSR